jgi:hypothetical protein
VCCRVALALRAGIYPDPVLELSRPDLEEIANALADQAAYEHQRLINPQTGEVVFWTADTGIDGQTPMDPDDLDLVGIDPLPSWIWYQDMADFAEAITDERAGRRLTRPIQGKGAFRRFKDELHEEHPDLLSACWQAQAVPSLPQCHRSDPTRPTGTWRMCAMQP